MHVCSVLGIVSKKCIYENCIFFISGLIIIGIKMLGFVKCVENSMLTVDEGAKGYSYSLSLFFENGCPHVPMPLFMP